MTLTDRIAENRPPLPLHVETEKKPYEGYTVGLAPFSHHDLGWTEPMDEKTILLARNLDEVHTNLRNDSRLRWTIEQTGLLYLYQSIRPPEAVQSISNLIQEGRAEVMINFTQPENRLTGEETIVRNKLIGGIAARQRFGVEPTLVDVHPDVFGTFDQEAQINKGFGIQTKVQMRGYGEEGEQLGAVHLDEAPDGTQNYIIRLIGGYAAASGIGHPSTTADEVYRYRTKNNPETRDTEAVKKFTTFMEEYKDYYDKVGFKHIFLGNGQDDEPIQTDIADVADVITQQTGAETEVITYGEYARLVQENIDRNTLATTKGEKIGSKHEFVVRGVDTTRIPEVKQINERVERSLLRAETLQALAKLHDNSFFPQQYESQEAWISFLFEQHHDTLGGCSTDEAIQNSQAGYMKAANISYRHTKEALAVLASGHEPRWNHREWELDNLSVINDRSFSRRSIITPLVPSHLQNANHLVAVTGKGEVLPAQIVDTESEKRAMVALDLNGYEAEQIRLQESGEPLVTEQEVSIGRIENQFYEVTVGKNGTINMIDKRTGEIRKSWFDRFLDGGDTYTPDPHTTDSWDQRFDTTIKPTINLSAHGPIMQEMEIEVQPEFSSGINEDMKTPRSEKRPLPIKTRVRLFDNIDRIDFQVTVDNNLDDHAVRMVFEAPNSDEQVRARTQYLVKERPLINPEKGTNWVEKPTDSNIDFNAVSTGDLILLSRGLPSYTGVKRKDNSPSYPLLDEQETEEKEEGTNVLVAKTLLRGTKWLSREDLNTRSGHASAPWNLKNAQCHGTHTFELGVNFQGNSASNTELARRADDLRYDFVTGPEGIDLTDLLNIEGNFLVTAVKPAEDGKGVIVRGFNPEKTSQEVRFNRDVVRTNLNEEIECNETMTSDMLKPHKIATYRIVLD